MLKWLFYLVLTTLYLPLWARPATPTYESLQNLMVEARDPLFQHSRSIYMQIAQTHMRIKLAKQLKTTPDNLAPTFIANQTLLDQLWGKDWIELQTEFYTTLHQEQLRKQWVTKTQKKKISDYGKNVSDAMFFHLSKYSAVKEGQLYTRWNEVAINKQGKNTLFRVPLFVFSKDINSLLNLEAHTPYEKLFPKEKSATPGNPSLPTFLNNVGDQAREKNQVLAEKIQLNHRIYLRAIANAAKTIASVHYLTGEFSYSQTEAKVSAFIEGYCDGCSQKEKMDYKKTAMAYITKTKSSFSQTYTGRKDIVNSFCSDLRKNYYIFDEPKKPEPVGLFSKTYIEPQDNTRVDQSRVQAQITTMKLSAIRNTIQQHDLGVLFLTHNLTELSSDRQPIGTRIGCLPDTLDADMKAVSRAIIEARQDVEKYIAHINQQVLNSTMNLKDANETLEYFTQTNISATSEAVMTFPVGIKHVIDSILELDRDVRRRKRIDKIVTWGGTIVGVALTITGIGAPEGVAILIAVGAMAKGIISGTYNLYRAEQEREFARELTLAKAGLGQNFYLDDNISRHYNDYRNLRISYIIDFAGAIFDFAHIHKIALMRNAGSVPKAHGFMKRIMQELKLGGKEVGTEQLTQAILTSVLH